jgi:hypothetical protein
MPKEVNRGLNGAYWAIGRNSKRTRKQSEMDSERSGATFKRSCYVPEEGKSPARYISLLNQFDFKKCYGILKLYCRYFEKVLKQPRSDRRCSVGCSYKDKSVILASVSSLIRHSNLKIAKLSLICLDLARLKYLKFKFYPRQFSEVSPTTNFFKDYFSDTLFNLRKSWHCYHYSPGLFSYYDYNKWMII